MRKSKLYVLISILGISFWFLLGFPFSNYHESYGWLAQFNTTSISEFIFQTIGHYSSYRPLGQAIAILLFKVFNDSMVFIQLFNYCLTILSFIILIRASKEQKFLTVNLLFIGGFFFLGFSYLFHLHGLYYSPLLLLISLLVYNFKNHQSLHKVSAYFCIAVLTSLFHPFALIIFIFYSVGIIIEQRKSLSGRHYFLSIIFLIVCVGLVMILVPDQDIHLDLKTLKGILIIYKSFDKNLMMSIIFFFLGIITIRSIANSTRLKNYFSVTMLLLSILFYIISIPIIVLWLLTSIFKVYKLKKWGLVFLVLVTSLFPIFTGVESKHLLFLGVIVSSYIMSLNMFWFESKLSKLNSRVIVVTICLIVSLFLLLKLDVKIPVISKLAHPLLVEKEKTHQLNDVIEWLLNSNYKDCKINLVSDCSTYSKSVSKKGQNQRLPTSNDYINAYLNSLNSHLVDNKYRKVLHVCFGGQILESSKKLFTVNGFYGGEVSVFISISKVE